MTQYFVDDQGRYIGGFDGAEPPEGAIEVPHPPADARMVWDGSKFGPLEPPVLSEADVIAIYEHAVDQHIDAGARAYGYMSILTAISYAEEPAVPKFQTEGQALRAWRSLCYAKCHEVLAAVKAQERDPPSVEQLLAEMPAINLPPPEISPT